MIIIKKFHFLFKASKETKEDFEEEKELLCAIVDCTQENAKRLCPDHCSIGRLIFLSFMYLLEI